MAVPMGTTPLQVQAQLDDEARDGDRIVVTGSRTGLETRQIGSSVSIVGDERIRAGQAVLVKDVLQDVPGLQIGNDRPGAVTGVSLRGSEHNDAFYLDAGRVRTRTNRSGGVQGGITNGETIYFRVAFKPTATIVREQPTVSVTREETTIKGRGRHDPCVLPRAVPMVEAMTALVLADHALAQQALGDAR